MSFFKFILKRKRFLWNFPKKILLYSIIKKVLPYTLVNYIPLVQVHDAILELDKKGIRGAVVETGCWKGGLGAFMAWTIKNKGTIKRDVWLFDSFEGLPSFENEDPRDMNRFKNSGTKAQGAFRADTSDVEEIVLKLNVKDITHIIKGWFRYTIPSVKTKIGGIALLRLDGDLYSSTKTCLDELYDQVVDGGYIIIDDYYNWIGCRKAVYEFFYERGISPTIGYCPSSWHYGCAFFKKIPDEVKLVKSI